MVRHWWTVFVIVWIVGYYDSSSSSVTVVTAWSVVLAGGTGPVGQRVASQLVSHSDPPSSNSNKDVTILARNAFLAATPSRVTKDYGWVGASFLQRHSPLVSLRDWDGGDLLDIVGQDWMGWQTDVLPKARVIVHLTGGGFTQQRVMACERLVRESLVYNPSALHITVNPTDELLSVLSPGLPQLKQQRVLACETMVQANCRNHRCLRVDEKKTDLVCDQILAAIADWESVSSD